MGSTSRQRDRHAQTNSVSVAPAWPALPGRTRKQSQRRLHEQRPAGQSSSAPRKRANVAVSQASVTQRALRALRPRLPPQRRALPQDAQLFPAVVKDGLTNDYDAMSTWMSLGSDFSIITRQAAEKWHLTLKPNPPTMTADKFTPAGLLPADHFTHLTIKSKWNDVAEMGFYILVVDASCMPRSSSGEIGLFLGKNFFDLVFALQGVSFSLGDIASNAAPHSRPARPSFSDVSGLQCGGMDAAAPAGWQGVSPAPPVSAFEDPADDPPVLGHSAMPGNQASRISCILPSSSQR